MAGFSEANLDPVLAAISRQSSLAEVTRTENTAMGSPSSENLPLRQTSSIGPIRTRGRCSSGSNARLPFTVPHLKDECRARGLKCTGKKQELLDRLQQDGFPGYKNPTLAPKSNLFHMTPELLSSTTTTNTSEACQMVRTVLHSSSVGDDEINDLQVPFQEIDDDADPMQSADSVDSNQVVKDATELMDSFERGFRLRRGVIRGEADEDSGGESEEEIEVGTQGNVEDGRDSVGDIAPARDSRISMQNGQDDRSKPTSQAAAQATEWADNYILQARRKSGRVTEQAVLTQWKRWVPQAINDGIIPDHIIDANLIIQYLKYAATRQLLTKRGVPKQTNERLSASSLKKIMTMLGRVRGRQEDDDASLIHDRPAANSRTADFYKAVMIQAQRHRLQTEDFDVAKNTILDQELWPEQFNEITAAIFGQNQVPTIVKSHFSWTWQATTLNRGDEVISLPMMCLQPYHVNLPDFRFSNGQVSGQGRRLFGVLSLFYQTKVAKPGKTAPSYSFVLPNRDILRCPIGALSIHLQYMFDQEQLCSKTDGWDWAQPSTYCNQLLMFGKTVNKPFTGDALGKMYQNFLDKTSITTKKKTHLARRTMPTILEDMGVPPDQVDATGNWAGNEWRETYTAKIPKLAVVALAGFAVGETYSVPWASVSVPMELQKKVFPFIEETVANLREHGCQNQGVYNFLQLLIELRPFFWQTMAAINVRFPTSGLLQRIKIVQCTEAKVFFSEWPSALKAREDLSLSDGNISTLFHETPTRHAVSAMSIRLRGLEDTAQAQTRLMERLITRTDPLSPSKQRSGKGPVLRFTSASASKGMGQVSSQQHATINMPMAKTQAFFQSDGTALFRASDDNQDIHMSSPPSSPVPQSQRLFNLSDSDVHIASPFGSPMRSTFASFSNLGTGTQPMQPSFCPSPTAPSPTFSGQSNVFVPYTLNINQKTYYVLPILPSLPTLTQSRSSHDLIIPAPAAYSPHALPTFQKSEINWHSVFSCVTDPVRLWDCYAPRSLGDYSDVRSIWQSWSEGIILDGIGRLPPLQLIEKMWGSLKNSTTGKGRLPSWRPRNDAKAQKIWGNYHFFVKRIEVMITEGQSSDDTIRTLEDQQQKLTGSKTINALHSALQVKKKTANLEN